MNDAKTFHFGLIGWPVAHSYSPTLHAAALNSCGFNGEYQLFAIPPFPDGKNSLAETINQVRNGSLDGINVTIPHKQNVITLLDELTPSAREIGAVNTIYMKDGKLIGDNTDAGGFLRDLTHQMPKQPGQKTALVLGAGGSSRAVTYALAREHWQVTVAARRKEQAEELVDDLSKIQQHQLSACELSPDVFRQMNPVLIVNTTPVGMSPHVTYSPWPRELPFPQNCFIYDLIYNPTTTTLARNAKDSGNSASGGLGMLVEQAALSFEIWTGSTPSRSAMNHAITELLEQEKSHDA